MRSQQEHSSHGSNPLEFSMHPPKGWIRKIRNQLGISGPQLAAKLGVTKQRISALEKAEVTGAASIKTMQQSAEALGCEFVYMLVPKGSMEHRPPVPEPQFTSEEKNTTSSQSSSIPEICSAHHVAHLARYRLNDETVHLIVELDNSIDDCESSMASLAEALSGWFNQPCDINTLSQLEELPNLDEMLSDMEMIFAT